jgi:GT2 family glycosyltransferase
MRLAKVSFVIVNWNRVEDVVRSVHYLVKLKGPNFEIIVIDNGSSDGSPERLEAIDSIRLIRLDSNGGPARARNVGIAQAAGEYIVFLDSDALLSKRGLKTLIDRMDRDPSLGVIGCKIVNSTTRRLDQWIYPHPARTHRNVEFETYSFSAAGAIVRSDALRKAGAFWEDLEIYNEEVDLSIRIIRAGYRIIYFPLVPVFHCVSCCGRKGSNDYWRLQIRNWIWIYYRHFPPAVRWRKVILYVLVYLIKGLANRRVQACLSGIIEGLRATEIITRYRDKLTGAEVDRFEALNHRTRIRIYNRIYN